MRGDSDTEDSFSGDEESEESSTTIRARLDSSSRLIQTSSAAEAPGAESASASTSKAAEGKDESSSDQIQGEGSKQDGGTEQGEEVVAGSSKKDGGGSSSSSGKEEDIGDSEMAPGYLKRLLPIFTEIYHSSLAPPLRKESLRLTRKMMHYIAAPNLQELCNEAANAAASSDSASSHPPFSAQISEVIAAVLENEDDHEGHLSALHIMQELLAKDRESFDEQFARLGLPTKIAALAGPAMEDETEVEEEDREESERGLGESSEGAMERSEEKTAAEADECDGETEKRTAKKKRLKKIKGAEKKQQQQQQAEEGGAKKEQLSVAQEDATEIVPFVAYQWREWCMVRSRDCLYLWNTCCAIELSSVSNGWFRFLVDNRLATMYSSGSTEGGPDSHGKGTSCTCVLG